jgi:hypothetical protein
LVWRSQSLRSNNHLVYAKFEKGLSLVYGRDPRINPECEAGSGQGAQQGCVTGQTGNRIQVGDV